jgi:hypothetical protein
MDQSREGIAGLTRAICGCQDLGILRRQAVPGTAILFVAISVAALLGACLILLVKPQPAVTVAERVHAV